MKIPQFLKPIIAIMICISLIRAVNNAGAIELDGIMLKLQSFDYDFEGIASIIRFFKNGEFTDGFASWNDSLTGAEGFYTNMRNILTSFFSTISSLIKVVVTGMWNVITEGVTLITELLDLILYIIGIEADLGDGFRGGR